MIRTGGDSRISNFLIWEVAYSEIVVIDKYWPEFTIQCLHEAVKEFSTKQRRFGKTSEQVSGTTPSSQVGLL